MELSVEVIAVSKSTIQKTIKFFEIKVWGLNFNTATETQKPSSLSHRWQYNSKEKLTDLGINWNDYGARMYMSDIGKMSTIDRFAERYEILTPYHYGANNPIKFIAG